MRTTISFKTITILLFSTLIAASVFAQLPIPIKVYGGGGLSEQDGPPVFSSWYNTGWHLTAGVGYNVMPMVELVGNFEHHSFPNNFSTSLGDVEGGDISATMFGLQVKVIPNLPMIPIEPYGLVGCGISKISQSEFNWPPEYKIGTLDWQELTATLEDQTKFYYNFGAGIVYSVMPKISLFAEARYTTIQVDAGETAFDNPIRFWALTAGVRLL